MRLSQICIERPVFSIVMSLVIVVLGGISLTRLSNRLFPDVDPPLVSVVTVLPGAAPEVVETSVTQVLEDEIIGIEGIKHLTSQSSEEVSAITVQFELTRSVDVAAADVRDRVARARERLPDEVKEPIVAKADADAMEIMWLNLAGGGLDQIELSTLAETRIKDRLSKLPGVAKVTIGGERRFAIRLWIDHERLTARGLTITDVADALARENVDIPSGRVEGGDQEFTVRTLGELSTAEQYGALILANRAGNPVRLRDVARAEVGARNERSLVRIDGMLGIGIGISKQSKANTLEVARAVRAEIGAIRSELPPGIVFSNEWDTSLFIEDSVRDVTTNIFYAVVLVLVVIFVFLRSLRATLIPAVSIPVSIFGSFALLYFLGYSINMLTLMAFTLAIGLVVDDAIVVLENVSRWIEQGVPRVEATRRAMEEIAFAVITASISVMAVFLPLAFLRDEIGMLFREFGITVAGAVGISAFVALTLSPTLCARILRRPEDERGVAVRLRDIVDRLRDAYARGLDRGLRVPALALGVAAAWVLLGVWLLGVVQREFIPEADRGSVMVMVEAPQGSTLEYTDRYQREVEEIVINTPETRSTFSIVGMGGATWAVPDVTSGLLFSSLVPAAERDVSQQQIVRQLNEQFFEIPGVNAYAFNDPLIWTNDFDPAKVALVVQGPEFERVYTYAEEIKRRAQAIPGYQNVRVDLKLNKPQLSVSIDRERASDLGVSVRDIATTLQILLGGPEISTFKLGGETYHVIAQLARSERANPTDLYGFYVRSSADQLVPLDSLVRVTQTVSAPALTHYDRLRAATLKANLSDDLPMGQALEQIQAIAAEVLPAGGGYRTTFSGESERFYESSGALLFAYLFAVVLIYLVLAAQFESFVHPATIMVAVVLSFPGALVALVLVNGIHLLGFSEVAGSLNLFSSIGMVMLVGLVTKNAILIVEFANQLRARGATPFDAVLGAARTRFRPVLMTALSTIAGILPIALGFGAGGEARAPLGVAVVGGMAFSTLLTFFVVPVVYLGFARFEERLRGRGQVAGAPAVAAQGSAGRSG
ncbi:MAG TPA: efflux RND transporter permease subunit [Myxococcota bacterium]